MRTHDAPALPEKVQEISLFEALKKEGFDVPQNCANVELSVARGTVFVLTYQVLVEGEDLAKIGRALERVAKGDLS